MGAVAPGTVARRLVDIHVRLARLVADNQHGPLTRNVSRALHILTEEVGECHKAYLAMTRADAKVDSWFDLLEELAQVASLVDHMMVNLVEEHSGK